MRCVGLRFSESLRGETQSCRRGPRAMVAARETCLLRIPLLQHGLRTVDVRGARSSALLLFRSERRALGKGSAVFDRTACRWHAAAMITTSSVG